MERSLGDILREEHQIGHKGDGGWKAIAYNTAAAILSAQFDIESRSLMDGRRIHGSRSTAGEVGEGMEKLVILDIEEGGDGWLGIEVDEEGEYVRSSCWSVGVGMGAAEGKDGGVSMS
ncbi:hypothetical protein L3X38_010147 [Prunus dulcis]|uniref:Uncharacterized protein n=1 Tax=Prunus dulcis TaxID=3755 RepID=A0AAD4WHQ9_PRUDU|nr:hypothetical protein L3X38_010147 [Prunus dulcis]